MPIPKPLKNEKYKHFMSRFLRNSKMKKEYPNIKQRFAIAINTWRNK